MTTYYIIMGILLSIIVLFLITFAYINMTLKYNNNVLKQVECNEILSITDNNIVCFKYETVIK